MEKQISATGFFQKIIFQKVADFENVFVSQFQMSENLAGVYDGFESVNGQVNGLTNEIQGAFAMFCQMNMTEMQSKGPPAMAHNPAPEMSQAGLARESEDRVAAQSPLPTLHPQKPSVPAAIPSFGFFPEQHGGGVEISRMIEIDERP